MRRLLSYPSQAKTLEMQKIGEPSRCSATLASVRPLVPAVTKVLGPCRSLPGRSARDAVAILENVFERFTSPGHQTSRRSCLLAGFLFDSEKAFDTMPRDRLWSAVASAANLKRFVGCTVTLARATSFATVSNFRLPKFMSRQGSVEGPLCFILLRALSITRSSKRETSTPDGQCCGFTCRNNNKTGPVRPLLCGRSGQLLDCFAKEPTLQVR